jgi:hypothetical protein
MLLMEPKDSLSHLEDPITGPRLKLYELSLQIPVSWKYILMFPFHICLGLQCCLVCYVFNLTL